MSTTQKRLDVQPEQPIQEPASGTTVFVDVADTDAEELSPYVEFFDAIERLEDDCVLFGTASLEARISRARVSRLREVAAAEWRRRQAA